MKSILFVMAMLCLPLLCYTQNESTQLFVFDPDAIGVLTTRDNIVLGTGFVAGNRNTLFTCAHVIHGHDSLLFLNGSSIPYILEVTDINYEADIAVLSSMVPMVNNAPLNLSMTKTAQLESRVHYISFDKELSDKVGNKPILIKRMANVSAVGKLKIGQIFTDFFEFNGYSRPGYSGSPIWNDEGEVIGILSMGYVAVYHKNNQGENMTRAVSTNRIINTKN